MFKGNKKVCCILLVLVLVLGTTAVNAEVQESTSSYKGVEVYCLLKCVLNITSNDRACTKTKWSGLEGYKVKANLYYKKNAFSDSYLVGKSIENREARVLGSFSGVWTYESQHFIHKNQTESSKATNKVIQNFEDW